MQEDVALGVPAWDSHRLCHQPRSSSLHKGRKIQWHRALGLEIATALFEMKSWQKNAALISPQVALSSLHNCAPALLVAAGNATSRILGVIREKKPERKNQHSGQPLPKKFSLIWSRILVSLDPWCQRKCTPCSANPWRELFTSASVCSGVYRAPYAHQVLTEEMNMVLW